MSKDECQDECEEKYCKYDSFKRNRYFHGMLMTDRDFREEQIYHNQKRKLQNKMLHGWGVVCGLQIRPVSPSGSKIRIEPGLALDAAGNEIFVSTPYELDLSKIKKFSADKKVKKHYVIIKYIEVAADPAHMYLPSGGCGDKTCEASRTKEGFCIDICRKEDLKKSSPQLLRKSGGPCSQNKKDEEIRTFLCEDLLMPYPADSCCCNESKIVLGSITINADKRANPVIEAHMINNWDCRKYVISFPLLDHWMRQLAPRKVPFETIVDYARLGNSCESLDSAADEFNRICNMQPDATDPCCEWIVHGQVVDKHDKGLEGLTVSVYDRDFFFDDKLGETVTGKNGEFEKKYQTEEFQDFIESKPDIYVKVLKKNKEELYSSENKVRFEAGRKEYFKIILGIDAWVVEGRIKDSSGCGMQGLTVSVWDHDKIFNDKLGALW